MAAVLNRPPVYWGRRIDKHEAGGLSPVPAAFTGGGSWTADTTPSQSPLAQSAGSGHLPAEDTIQTAQTFPSRS